MNYLMLVLLAALTAIPAGGYAEQAQTLDEFIRMYDSSRCKGCHAGIYKAWEGSHHARPLMGVGGRIFLIPVLKSSPFAPKDPARATAANFPCFKCHLPHVRGAAQPVFAEIAKAVLADDRKTISKLRITCLVCHNELAIIHRLEEGRPKPGVIYSTKEIKEHPDEVYTTVRKSVIMKEAVVCGQCHGTGPNFDNENPYQCATLYGSYLHAYIPAGGAKTCQQCHMEKGGHSFPPDMNNLKSASAFMRKNISLDVQTTGYQFLPGYTKLIPMVVVNTRITTRAGHRTPDG